jgi:hypothetical protein
MFDIIRLHAELQQNRIEAGLEKEDSIIPRTARLERQLDEDIEYFVKSGIDNPYYIARELGRHPYTIKVRLGAIERKLERPNDIDVITGAAFSTGGGYVGISPK